MMKGWTEKNFKSFVGQKAKGHSKFATEYLTQQGFDYSISYDHGVRDYCFTTNYSGSWYATGVKK